MIPAFNEAQRIGTMVVLTSSRNASTRAEFSGAVLTDLVGVLLLREVKDPTSTSRVRDALSSSRCCAPAMTILKSTLSTARNGQ